MDMLKDRLWEANDRQRIYAAKRRKDLELHMSDLVYLKIRTFQGRPKTQKLKELKPRYMRLYPSLEWIEVVACSCFISIVSAFHDLVHMTALQNLRRP